MSSKTAIDWNNEGLDLYNSKKYDEATTAFLKAIELDKSNPIFFKNLGDVYYDTGKTEDSLKYYKTALQMDDKNVFFLIDYAIILHTEKQDRLALSHLLKAIEIEPENGDALYQLIVIYYSLNEIQMTMKFCQRLLTLNPTHQDSQLILARCYLDQKNLPSTEKTLDTLLEINPQNVRALHLRAQVAKQQQKTVEAIQFIMKAFEVDKNNPAIIDSLYSYMEEEYLFGRLFLLVNQYREFHEVVDSYLGKRIRTGKELLDYLRLGVEFREALGRDTQDLSYTLDAEELSKMVDNVENFLYQIEKQSKEDPEQDSSKLLQGFFAFTQKKFSLALEILSELTTRLNTEIYYFLFAAVSFLQGSYEQSYKVWGLFIKFGKENGPNNLFYAYCAFKLKQEDMAKELLLKSHKFNPHWQIYFPTLEAFKESSIEEDLFGIAVQKLFKFLNQ